MAKLQVQFFAGEGRKRHAVRRIVAAGAAAILVLGVSAAIIPAFATTTHTVCASGCDFTTIQSAIDASSSGDTISVQAGTYLEDLTINKSLTLLGPNQGVNPNTATRVAEAAIVEPVNGTPTSSGPNDIVVTANNVTIDGFTIDGHNPGASAGDINAAEGITATDSTVTIANDIIQHHALAGVDAEASTVDNVATVQDNRVLDVPGLAGYGGGWGVVLGSNAGGLDSYGSVTDNVMLGVRRAIQIDSNSGSTAHSVVISGNQIDAGQMGIWVNNSYGTAAAVTVQNNTITSTVASTFSTPNKNYSGIFLASQWSTIGTVTVTNNDISGLFDHGILAWNNAKDITVQGGTISAGSMQHGVLVQSLDDPYGSVFTGGQGILTLQGVHIFGAPTGVMVNDNGDDSSYASVNAAVQGSTITGGGTAIDLTGPKAVMTAHQSDIANNTVAGVANASTTTVDATNNWWGCKTGPNTAGCDNATNTGTGSIIFDPWLMKNPFPPVPTSMNPSAFGPGTVNRLATIMGTGFQTGATVAVSGSGVALTSPTFVDANDMTVRVKVVAGAAPGPRDVTVYNTDGGVGRCTGCLTVDAGPVPTSVNPSAFGPGTVNRLATIMGTGFQTGATVAVSGSGVALTSPTFVDANDMTVRVKVVAGAAPGPRDVTVYNTDGGVGRCTGCLTVDAGPVPTSMNPSAFGPGTVNRLATIMGTGFQTGATVAVSGSGVALTSPTFVDANDMTVRVKVVAGAAAGPRDVTVYNTDGGVGRCTGCLTVDAAPTVTSAIPNTEPPGASLQTVLLSGTGFVSGATVSINSGVIVNNVGFVDASDLNLTVSVSNSAALGPRTVTVTNPDGGVGSSKTVFSVGP